MRLPSDCDASRAQYGVFEVLLASLHEVAEATTLSCLFTRASREVRGLRPNSSSNRVMREGKETSGKVRLIPTAGTTYSSHLSGHHLNNFANSSCSQRPNSRRPLDLVNGRQVQTLFLHVANGTSASLLPLQPLCHRPNESPEVRRRSHIPR